MTAARVRTYLPALNYLALIFIFGQALLRPEANLKLLYDFGIFVFAGEFLSYHFATALSGTTKLFFKVLLCLVYLVVVVILSVATGTGLPAVMLGLSLISKLLSKPPTDRVLYASLLYFAAVYLVATQIQGFITASIPLPAEVIQQQPRATTGILNEAPQVLMVWGVVYYFGLLLAVFWPHIKPQLSRFRGNQRTGV